MIFLARRLSRRQSLITVLLLTLILVQLVRVVAFVSVYGGLEHDGGWLLGISRSLAERGEYTTLVSTIVDPTVRGGINVDGKFDIQDDRGRIWFFTGNGIGPASIGLNALFLKLFGTGFWPLHLGPLFYFVCYLALASLILLKVRGAGSMLFFHLYLFLYPTLSIFLGYEAMGEVPAMVFILLAYGVFSHSLGRTGKGRLLWFFLSGLVAGLAINTKLIALLSLGGIFILWLKLWWERRTTFLEGSLLGLGVLTVQGLWELTHLVVLTRLAGFEMYRQNLQGRLQFFLVDGSGVGGQSYSGAGFYWDKALIVSEISHPARILSLLALLLIAVGGPVLIGLYRQNSTRQNWLILLWVGWLGNAIWFIGLAQTGWVRHAWFELILAVMILCIIVGELLHRLVPKPTWPGLAAGAVVAGILLPGFVAQRQAATLFIGDDLVERWHQEQLTAKYSKVPWIITPRAEQERLIEFLEQLPEEGRIFYPANHKAAEIAVQMDKIFYPVERRMHMPPAEGDVVLVGATLISPWKDPGFRHSILDRVRADCPNFLYESDYYIVCTQQESW